MNGQQFVQFIFSTGQNAAQPDWQQKVPARVRVALELLNQFTAKTAERAAVNEVAVTTMDGQKLTPGEEDAQQTACSMLVQYFEGKLKPNAAESLEIREESSLGRGTLINCLACDPNRPLPSCNLCHGTGKSILYPSIRERP